MINLSMWGFESAAGGFGAPAADAVGAEAAAEQTAQGPTPEDVSFGVHLAESLLGVVEEDAEEASPDSPTAFVLMSQVTADPLWLPALAGSDSEGNDDLPAVSLEDGNHTGSAEPVSLPAIAGRAAEATHLPAVPPEGGNLTRSAGPVWLPASAGRAAEATNHLTEVPPEGGNHTTSADPGWLPASTGRDSEGKNQLTGVPPERGNHTRSAEPVSLPASAGSAAEATNQPTGVPPEGGNHTGSAEPVWLPASAGRAAEAANQPKGVPPEGGNHTGSTEPVWLPASAGRDSEGKNQLTGVPPAGGNHTSSAGVSPEGGNHTATAHPMWLPVQQSHAAVGQFEIASAPPETRGPLPQETAESIIQSLRMQYQRGGGDAVVHIKPEHLGPVSISLRVENGSVTAVVNAENPAVAEWLKANEHLLRDGLASSGLHLERFAVKRDGQAPDDGRRGWRPPDERERRRRGLKPESTFEITV